MNDRKREEDRELQGETVGKRDGRTRSDKRNESEEVRERKESRGSKIDRERGNEIRREICNTSASENEIKKQGRQR